ncbi:hypothetical protein [Caballeronia humi]|uniref:Uncharacterized protein n=1 Tax=Caballeronia humi TaxID=326474 RepID=A0A158JAP4_9BURK|nr:hypothetical protein [Caballeronia humi]SAL65847.1 hypothetical protein AWB65_06248 [Caballeronia humi]
MNRLIGYLVVAAGCFAFSGPISAWMPSRNEATVYMLSCDEKPVDGVCRGTEMTVVPLTYRVLADQNSVSYWETDDPGRPQRFPYCFINDAKNWWCQWTEEEVPSAKFGMVAGRYAELSTCRTIETTERFYEVSRWRWWFVRMHEKLA